MADVDSAPSQHPQTQPHGATESPQQQQQDTPSDPSSSSNSTNMTGSQTHARSDSSYSDPSPPPAGDDSKFFSAESSAPSSPEEVRSAIAAATSSQLKRPQKNRARSSSSGVLARLTSRSSSYIADHLDSGSTIKSHASTDSSPKPKLDRAALAKPKGKYKSAVNWDTSVINLTAGEEPFMEQVSPTKGRSKEEVEDQLKIAELEQMAAAGSTKAALAWSRANSFGDPVFNSHRRAMGQAPSSPSPQGSSTPTTTSAPRRMKSPAARPPVDVGRSSNLRFKGSDMNGISEDAASRETSLTREGPQQIRTQDLISGVGQQVLDSAKRAALEHDDAHHIQPGDEPLPPPIPEASPQEAQKAAKLVKRRTFLNFGKKDKKKVKGIAVPEEADDEAEGGATESNGQTGREEEFRPVNNGTASRRRRFNDTRQLDLLANELAAEALMGSPENYPSIMPETRRASMMSMLAPATAADLGAASSNTSSQINLGLNNLVMPQPAFANDHNRSGSPANSSRSSSPRMPGTDSPRFDPPRAPFARSQQSLNSSPVQLASQKAKLTGLPADMLTGLGDGPYPTMFSREREMSDSYVMPMSLDGGYESGRSSLPDGQSKSRRPSAGSATNPKRSVLQMSMHNPDSELQGLTKPPKSSRSTPFGSRAPSKQVTPHASSGNLRDKANSAVSPTLLSSELAKNGASTPKDDDRYLSPGVMSDYSDGHTTESHLSSQSKNEEKMKVKADRKENRKSFFGRKSKSKLREGDEEVDPNQNLAPPLPMPSTKAQSLRSTSSKKSGLSAIGGRLTGASRSAQSLVKVPSSSPSHATTSASSHDRGAFANSSDGGGSQRQGVSAVTTPETLPAKMDLTSMPPVPAQPVSHNYSLPQSMNNASLQPNKGSTLSPTPRSMSAASSKASTNTLGRLNKFKSIFASKPSSAPSKATPTSALNQYNAEKSDIASNSPLNQSTPSQNGATPARDVKYYQRRMNGKTAV